MFYLAPEHMHHPAVNALTLVLVVAGVEKLCSHSMKGMKSEKNVRFNTSATHMTG